MNEAPIDVSVCVATFRRPQGLARLLRSLESMCDDTRFTSEVVIVDNDAEGSAQAVAEAWRPRFAHLTYVIETERGISQARNRGVAVARGRWIAFIDDDEEACPGWLQAYEQAAQRHDADGYFGPVRPCPEGAAPAWFSVDAFFPYPELPDAGRIDATHTRTGNAFLRRDLLGEAPFDPAFALTGGGDYDLFARLVDAGACFRWCAAAATIDYLPAERLTWRWLLQRAFRGGYTYTLIDRRRHPGWSHDLRRITRALGGGLLLAATWPLAALRGKTNALLRLRRIAVQCGHLWCYLGPPVRPYDSDQRRGAETQR